jgi:hypothetical protein
MAMIEARRASGRRGDQHRVDIGAFCQELADVAIGLAIVVAVLIVHELLHGKPLLFVGIADGDELHVGLAHHPLQVAHPSPA